MASPQTYHIISDIDKRGYVLVKRDTDGKTAELKPNWLRETRSGAMQPRSRAIAIRLDHFVQWQKGETEQ